MYSMSNAHNVEKSSLSCHSCRGRKVRCDRVLPGCLVCARSSQVCIYPLKSQRPGPKIGSSQRRRKQRRESYETNLCNPDSTNQSYERVLRDSHPSPPLSEPQSGVSCQTSRSCGHESPRGSSFLAEAGNWGAQKRESRPDLQKLSFILHPSHETSYLEEKGDSTPLEPVYGRHGPTLLEGAAMALGITQNYLDKMIRTYFDNMTAISLFHEPTFFVKLNAMQSSTELHGLLAAMLAYAANFDLDEECTIPSLEPRQSFNTRIRSTYFLDLALKYTDEALKECADGPPSLSILQAFILTAHRQLTQGVLGKAWRTLGTCVRLSYEINLHLIDLKDTEVLDTDHRRWCANEEKRRAWWAVWEMDVFATTVRRTPPAVAWTQMETLLPIEDEYWFQSRFRPSCYFEDDPIHRWRSLQLCENQSPKAWYIVINSLMKDAQTISSPRGIPNLSQYDVSQPRGTVDHKKPEIANDAHKRLETLANAVQCIMLTLPANLQFRDQFLGFDARVGGQLASLRQTHCSIYNIHVMTQLTRLMIYRYDVFKYPKPFTQSTHQTDRSSREEESPLDDGMGKISCRRYFEAADSVLRIINHCGHDHTKFLNPFLSSSIWLASAVQLFRLGLSHPGTDRSLIRSKFEVLHLAYKKCVRFWGIQTVVQRNLEQLEAQLEASQASFESGNGGNDNSQAFSDPKEIVFDPNLDWSGNESYPRPGSCHPGSSQPSTPCRGHPKVHQICANHTDVLQQIRNSTDFRIPSPTTNKTIPQATNGILGSGRSYQNSSASTIDFMCFPTHPASIISTTSDPTQTSLPKSIDPSLGLSPKRVPSSALHDSHVPQPVLESDFRDIGDILSDTHSFEHVNRVIARRYSIQHSPHARVTFTGIKTLQSLRNKLVPLS